MNTLAAVFGRRLKMLRKVKGHTQEELGRMAKVDFKYLGALERGEKTPSFPTIERLAKALSVEYYELFTSDGASAAQLEKSLQSALVRLNRLERPEVQDFFREMVAAVKRLDSRLPR